MTTMFAASPSARQAWLWLLPAALAVGLTLLIMLVMPPERTLHGFGDFLLKVSPLMLAVVTIAMFPNRGPLGVAPLVLGVLFYFGFIDSAFFIQVDQLVQAAQSDAGPAQFAAYYRFSIFVNAFVVMLGVFAFRMGGASTSSVLRLGSAGILILLSGLNDLTMWAMYPWRAGMRPETFDWASHVSIFLGGRSPTLIDMLVFLAIHLTLVVATLRLPLPARPISTS
jgi:hypothetical protein